MVLLLNSDDFSLECNDRVYYHLITVKGSFTVKHLLEIRNKLNSIIEHTPTRFIWNLRECEEMDSSAIGILSNFYKQTQKLNGTMGLLAPNDNLISVLKNTGLTTIIPLFSNLEDVDSHYDTL